jgi:DNA-binding winged helix-turn-helix (wHTH) protein
MALESTTFGPFRLDPASLTLEREGKAVALDQRSLALLQALVSGDGETVGKAVLMEAGWPGTVVEEGNLTVQIAALRKALGSRPDGSEWIVTVPRVGYRLVRSEQTTQVPKPSSPLPSLAVLPFQNLSSDPEQDYFADGIVEDITTALSRFKSFAGIARNSSFVYKGRVVDVRQIAQELSWHRWNGCAADCR